VAWGPGCAGGALLKSRPGLALSNDGRNWASVEGSTTQGPSSMLAPTATGTAPSCGSPHVVFHAPGDLRMFYHALDTDSELGSLSIGMAGSRDGIKWVKWGKALAGSAVHPGLGCINATSSPTPASFPSREEEGGQRHGVRAPLRGGQRHHLPRHLPDGLSNWTYNSELLHPSGDSSAWDCISVGAPCLVDMWDGKFRLYYQGVGPAGARGIGVAECAPGSGNL